MSKNITPITAQDSDDPELRALARRSKRGKLRRILELFAALFSGFRDWSAFIETARVGDEAGVRKWIVAGMHPDVIVVNKETREEECALRVASKEGHSHVVRTLLAVGATVDACDKFGNTALMLAGEHPDVVTELLRGGADVNARTHNGFTPLMGAALGCHAQSVRILIDAGADVNAEGADGISVLMAAGMLGTGEERILTGRALLDAGAKFNPNVPVNDVTKGGAILVKALMDDVEKAKKEP